MATGQFVTVKLMRGGSETPWGFRLQGGLEFGVPLSVVKVTNGSLSEQCGVQVGDILLKINGKECEQMRHKEAQDLIVQAGNYIELYLERGPMSTWRPSVTPVSEQRSQQQVFTRTSLAKSPETQTPIGSGHNTAAKPFQANNGPALVHKQYNSPVNLYSERNIEETLNAHSQVLASGATGINFMRPDAPVNTESAVYQMVRDEEMRKSKGVSGSPDDGPRNHQTEAPVGGGASLVTRHVSAPSGKPNPVAVDNGARNVCGECERPILGVFVRINNKSLHAECFRCATCGTSLKNNGYFKINDKLYCDIHARQIKQVLGSTAVLNGSSEPSPTAPATVTNGHQASPQPVFNSPPPVSVPIAPTVPSLANNVPYQGPSQMNFTHNGFHNTSTVRKYSPVVPPTANKPAATNRNSMYVNNPAPFRVEAHTSDELAKSNWAPSSITTENTVAFRQNPQHHERPKSCFNLPSYSVTTSTYTTRSSNPAPPNSYANNNGALPYPKTATYQTSTTTTTEKIVSPASGVVSQVNLASSPNVPRQSVSQSVSQWSGQASQGAKTAVSLDAKSAPRRGRGLLQSQLSGGVIPFCGYCSQPIRGQYIMALNKSWCPNHFVCANSLCKRSLEENGFVEETGRLYCECCYEQHFAPACAKCNQRIKGDCLNALDKQWHPNCFVCSYCKKPFGNSSFYLEDGFPYCEKDWNDLFTTKCVGCGFPIAAGDRWVEALNQNYHSNCFKCTVCANNLEGQSFFAKGGRPFCRVHAR